MLTAWGGASLAGLLGVALIYAAGGSAEGPPDIALAAEAIAPAGPLEVTPTPVALAAATPAVENAPVRMARVPRARPDEPMITGSIRPVIEPAEEPVASGWPSGGGLVELKRRYDLRKQEASLPEVANAGPASDRAALDILAAGGSVTAGPPPRVASLGDADAVRACEDNLRTGLPAPASYSRIFPSTGVYRAPGDDAVVTFDFHSVNGFGQPMALQVQCVFQGDTLARLDIVPR